MPRLSKRHAPGSIEAGAQVLHAAVRREYGDSATFFNTLQQLDRGGNVCTGRIAAENAFGLREESRRRDCVVVADRDVTSDEVGVVQRQIGPAVATALDRVVGTHHLIAGEDR